jgi:hypothetical protein
MANKKTDHHTVSVFIIILIIILLTIDIVSNLAEKEPYSNNNFEETRNNGSNYINKYKSTSR